MKRALMDGDNTHHHLIEEKHKHRHYRHAGKYLSDLAEDLRWCETKLKDLVSGSLDKTVADNLKLAFHQLTEELSIQHIKKPLYHLRNKGKPFRKVREHQIYNDQVKQQEILKASLQNSLQNLKGMRVNREFKNMRTTAIGIRKRLLNYQIPDLIPISLRYLKNTILLLKDTEKSKELNKGIAVLESRILERNQFEQEIISEICETVGNSYLEQYHFRPNLTKEQNYKRISYMKKMIKEQIDPFVQSTDFPFLNEAAFRKDCEDLLNTAKDILELAWLCYELAKTFTGNKKWDHAVAECKNCIDYAKDGNSKIWELNGLILMAFLESRRREGGEAIPLIEECIHIAYELKNEHMIEFTEGFKHVMDREKMEYNESPGEKLVNDREKLIISLMDDVNQKAHIRKLLSGIRAQPRERRLCIVPGGDV